MDHQRHMTTSGYGLGEGGDTITVHPSTGPGLRPEAEHTTQAPTAPTIGKHYRVFRTVYCGDEDVDVPVEGELVAIEEDEGWLRLKGGEECPVKLAELEPCP